MRTIDSPPIDQEIRKDLIVELAKVVKNSFKNGDHAIQLYDDNGDNDVCWVGRHANKECKHGRTIGGCYLEDEIELESLRSIQ